MVEEGRGITKEGAKEKIRKLANSFSNTPAKDLDKKSEEQIKFQFIEPLLEALGWQKEDIEKEQRVLKGRADYILKIGNQEVMVIEAKRTNVSLDDEEGRQAVSYAYHRKIKFAVLTNFKQIKVYHALSNIKNINKNLLRDDKGYLVLNSYDFEKEFERLLLLSRESFEKGVINKLLSAKDEKVSKPIDESILEDLLQFRDWLSKDLKKLRMQLSDEAIDEIVQILIDRLIFMRSVEDRGLEEKGLLLNMLKDTEQGRTEKVLWGILKDAFRAFDKTYNSKLFSEGLLEKEGFFDEETLKKVIKGLYFGTKDNRERYMFDEIPGDLLGNIYEQYLGTVLRGSDKRVKLEEGTGKRKKMGIYYTPSYIVDYIVKNTVGEYIRNKTIDEILDTRIVDPACGSGSFLIRAFREVCDVVEAKLKRGERSGNWKLFKDYKGRLNLGQKMQILTNCIYGVDLDEKAVELAQLNLLLRLLEDETRETRKQLPPLKDNIKCGNSLIDDLAVSDKAFSWRAQFPKVFAQGGFDVVVGNPPYGREQIEMIHKAGYLKADDIYIAFLLKCATLLKESGFLGFIIPVSWETGERYYKFREEIFDKIKISRLINLPFDVFEEAYVDTGIAIFKKSDIADKFLIYSYPKSEPSNKLIDVDKKLKTMNYELISKDTYKRIFPQPSVYELIGRFKGNNNIIALGEITKSSIGILASDYKINDKGISKSYIPFFIGNIYRYLTEKDGLKYVDFSKHEGKEYMDYYKGERLLIRRIVNRQNRLMSNFETEAFVTKKDLYSFKPITNDYDIKYILGLLNSKLFSYLYLSTSTIATKDDFRQTTLSELRRLPIFKIEKDKQKKIAEFVMQMLSLQKKYRAGNVAGREKELLEQQIKQVDWEIDQEVYKIYGISEEEKRVIEESLK